MLSNYKDFKILHWNAQGMSNQATIAQLDYVLNKEKVDIALINETFLKKQHKVHINNYKVYRNDREDRPGGGVAIIIHLSIAHTLLPLYKTMNIESASIEVTINNRKIVITTAYSPRYYSSFMRDIKIITPRNREFLVFGDFNAKHSSWNCPRANAAGNILNNLQQRNHFFVFAPGSPTRFPSQTTIDLLLTNSPFNIGNLEVTSDLPSDHAAIICHLETESTVFEKNWSYNYQKADWNQFRAIIKNNLTPFDCSVSIDIQLNQLTNLILEARDQSIPKLYRTEKLSQLSPETVVCIRERNRLRRLRQRTSNLYNLSPQINILNRMISTKVHIDRNNNWSRVLEKCTKASSKFWNLTKSLRGKNNTNIPKLKSGTTVIFSDKEKANELAHEFEKAHKLTLDMKHSVDKSVKRSTEELKNNNRLNIASETYPSHEEIKAYIKSSRPSKAPGMDKITNQLLKKLPEEATELIFKLFKESIRKSYFPIVFRRALVIPIPKANKDKTVPSSYRPISLLSNLGKIFEKIILFRLNSAIEENNLIAESQFGFRKSHSTIHQLKRVTKIVQENKSNRHSTGMLLFDIEKAFDTVWHNGLVHKLIHANVPTYLCKIIQSFLTERTFTVKVNNSVSNERKIVAGVPQGSVLSPLLYSFYISDYKPLRCTLTSYFADDTAHLVKGKQTGSIVKNMTRSYKHAERYLAKWKIKVNAAKTQAIVFPYNKSPKRIPSTPINTENETIQFTNQVTYLGVTLDKHLLYHKHVEKNSDKTLKCLRSLYPLLCKKSKLSHFNKTMIFKTIIRPVMTYAGPIWTTAAKTNLKKLQVIQNKCLKIINKLPWRFSTNELHSSTGFKKLAEHLTEIKNKFNARCASSVYPLILDLAE